MTDENITIIGKIILIFTCMIVGMVLIILGLNLENLFIGGLGGTLFFIGIIAIISIISNL